MTNPAIEIPEKPPSAIMLAARRRLCHLAARGEARHPGPRPAHRRRLQAAALVLIMGSASILFSRRDLGRGPLRRGLTPICSSSSPR